MKVRTDLIAPNVHRISVTPPNSKISFNHFLIADKKPALIHMGQNSFFEPLLEATRQHIDPSTLRHLCFSHVEADECGALNRWLDIAPKAKATVGKLCANSVRDFASRKPLGLADGETINLGQERLRLIETPHVPHGWDACLFWGENSKVLFGSDLGTQAGIDAPFRDGDFTDEMLQVIEKLNYMTYGPHVHKALNKLKQLPIGMLAAMHGAALDKGQAASFLQALAAQNIAANKLA